MVKWGRAPAQPAIAGERASGSPIDRARRTAAGWMVWTVVTALVLPATSAHAFQSLPAVLVERNVTSPPLIVVAVNTPRAATTARMTPQLADNLALLFDRFERAEFILCLEGTITETGELALNDFRMPHIAHSRATSAALHPSGTCAQYNGILGTVHTHPPTYPEDRGREAANCYLSRTDIVSWLEASHYSYTAVMCGPRTWAWWHRSQVNPRQVLAFPPEHQLHQPETAGSPQRSHGVRR